MDDLARNAVVIGDDPAITSILNEVCETTAMGFAALARVTDSRWIACQVVDKIEFGLKPGEELSLKTTICDEIRQSGKAVVIDHVGGHDTWRTHPIPMLYGFESYASLPIYLKDGSFFGTLCAIDPEPRMLTSPTVIEALKGYADRITALIAVRDWGDTASRLPRE